MRKSTSKDGEEVEAGTILALPKGTELPKKRGKKKVETPEDAVVANVGGTVEVQSTGGLSITWADTEEREHLVPVSALLLLRDGDEVKAGTALTAGPLNPHDILRIKGKEDVQAYLVDEVQKVYRSQGVSIHNKHIEVVVRQMLRRVQVGLRRRRRIHPRPVPSTFSTSSPRMLRCWRKAESPPPPSPSCSVSPGPPSSPTASSPLPPSRRPPACSQKLPQAAVSTTFSVSRKTSSSDASYPPVSDAELPTVEEQYMLGDDDLILEGDGDDILDSDLIKEFTDSLTEGLDDLGNGHADVEVDNPVID